MAADPDRLVVLAAAVADGEQLDWRQAESQSATEDERELVRQLRLLANLATAHESAIGAHPSTDAAGISAGRSVWGSLHIREQVGAGTYGAVYRAWDPRLERDVALKLLHLEAARTQPTQVIEEGRLLARVRHPNVITVFGADTFDGRVGIWMEFIRGRTLEAIVADNGPLGSREAALLGIDLCAALAAVHREGLVHRDVKMQNVMREHGGRVILMDFGAGHDAAESPSGLAGTPCYMAPELFDGGTATPRSDVFSLGVLLFRAVSGEYPIDAETLTGIRQAHTRRGCRRLVDVRADLPPAFVQVVERALAPNPSDRFSTAGEMGAALAGVLADQTPKMGMLARLYRRRGGLIAAVLGLAVLTAILARQAILELFVSNPVHTVVVLPLANVGGHPDDDYFADGVTEILSSRLWSIPGTRVIARSSIAAVPVNERDPPSLHRRFGAAYTVEGSVDRKKDRVLVTTRLIQASTGAVLWGETYDRPIGDQFALQGDIALAMASAMGLRIGQDVTRRLQTRQSSSTEAQEAYMRGRYLLYTFNRARFPEARRFFERAVAIDPEYAIAHAALARTSAAMMDLDVGTVAELQPLALAAAARAFELDPELPETIVALADVKYRFDRDWTSADQLYRRALSLAPHAAIVLSPYARFLCAAGRLDEALRYAEEGERADPLSPEMVSTVGLAHYYARDLDGALRHFNRVASQSPQFGPVHFGIARVLSAKGDYRAAIDHIGKAKSLVGASASYEAELARNFALGGWRESAEQILGALLLAAESGPGPAPHEGIGYLYAALGDHDRAFEWLNRALDHYFARMLFLNVDPRADPLRNDPRFAVLVQRLGLEVKQ